jgi:beta-glucosidase
LLGRNNPGAKLPVSVIRNEGQIPLFYNRKPSSRRGYLFDDAGPLFPFGHGLSYTTFEISDPRLSKARVTPDKTVTVEATVRNTGARAGDEVVQLYITRTEVSVTRPVLLLKGFERVSLQPGESRTVRFTLTPSHLAIWNREMKEVNEPGPVAVHVGNSSAKLKTAQLVIA